MSGSLPAGAKVPVTFAPGETLTAEALTKLQVDLLSAILTHNHSGNSLATQQGVQVGAAGIAAGAVGKTHIQANAVERSHIATGAVGADEIAEHVIGPDHIKKDGVVTDGIKNGNVTLEKLAADVIALLTAPRTGATTFGYFAWLDGEVVFPPKPGGKWWDWLVQAKEPVRIHDLPVMRRRDDGGWQPVESILPPSDVTKRPIGRIGRNAETGGAGAETELTREVLAEATAALVEERERIAMTVNPEAVGWDAGVAGVSTFHPGIGGNAAFSDSGLPVKFQLRKAPSAEERVMAERIFENCGVELENADLAALLRISKIYDFLNNPQLLPAGYWTGQSQNVKAVYRTRLGRTAAMITRIKFITPYVDSGYAVCLTPELTAKMEVAPTPVVLHRSPTYLDVGFRYVGSFVDKVNFNLAIHGELAES